VNQPLSKQQLAQLVSIAFFIPIGAAALLVSVQSFVSSNGGTATPSIASAQANTTPGSPGASAEPKVDHLANKLNGRPQLSPLPNIQESWECDVVVVGGTLGGVAAASQAMRSGAKTCLIELSPWMGGQISAQGVSAIDESTTMRREQNFSRSWTEFKQIIKDQEIMLPAWTNQTEPRKVSDLNSCWVGSLCFLPKAGAQASSQYLEAAAANAPGSRWQTSTAFKGAEFDDSGKNITAVYAVRRIPLNPNYVPEGRPSVELPRWYSWDSDETFTKVPLKLQAPPGKKMLVIDATDTGEIVGWAGIPYRLGSEARTTTSESFASRQDNPDCTQAFTFPFVLAIRDDQRSSQKALSKIVPEFSKEDHRNEFDLGRFPMFEGGSFFHYRRIVSTQMNDPVNGLPSMGDMTLVNWNKGNDWIWMDPPLILNEQKISKTGQHQNWMGGLSMESLRHAENHSFIFAEWLMETQAQPNLPLTYLYGADEPMGTVSGLSIMPYIREGRRIMGRSAYGQDQFMMREPDLRKDMRGSRDFSPTSVGVTHYSIDMHGCRYRNSEYSWEASSAPVEDSSKIKPIVIPLEALIPQGVDNLLIGGKGIAASHIVNAATRVHYGEWVIGSAAGATAGWITTQQPDLTPAMIVPKNYTGELQQYLEEQGARVDW
jgi:FAD dependent oxidoreductase